MKDFEKSPKVVISTPPKKLSDYFISNEQVDKTLDNVWCFNQATALELLLDADSKRSTDIKSIPSLSSKLRSL